METPRYEHDCEKCVFLGAHTKYDLYYCPTGGLGDTTQTLIARWGSEPPSYTSGMVLIGKLDAITEAARLAKERGLIQPKEIA